MKRAVLISAGLALVGACTTDYETFHVNAKAGAGGATSAAGGAGPTTVATGAGGIAGGSTSNASSSGNGGQAGAQGGGGCGGSNPSVLGCSDGTRELFDDPSSFPDIAGCSGAWLVGGTQTADATMPRCDRGAGNPGCKPTGEGCSIADLCAAGWHVCASNAEVASKSPAGCGPGPSPGSGYWLTRQMVDGGEQCSAGGYAHFVGCGNIGQPITMWGTTCDPLNAVLGGNHGCPMPWVCGPTVAEEPYTVYKTGPELGGVLCCSD